MSSKRPITPYELMVEGFNSAMSSYLPSAVFNSGTSGDPRKHLQIQVEASKKLIPFIKIGTMQDGYIRHQITVAQLSELGLFLLDTAKRISEDPELKKAY